MVNFKHAINQFENCENMEKQQLYQEVVIMQKAVGQVYVSSEN